MQSQALMSHYSSYQSSLSRRCSGLSGTAKQVRVPGLGCRKIVSRDDGLKEGHIDGVEGADDRKCGPDSILSSRDGGPLLR